MDSPLYAGGSRGAPYKCTVPGSGFPRFLIPWPLIVPGACVLEKLRNHCLKGSFSSGGDEHPLCLIGADTRTWPDGESGGAESHTRGVVVVVVVVLPFPSAKPSCQARAVHLQ